MQIHALLGDLPELATTAQVARVLGVDTRTVRRYLRDALLEGVKLGNARQAHIRITRSSVAQLLEESAVHASEELSPA